MVNFVRRNRQRKKESKEELQQLTRPQHDAPRLHFNKCFNNPGLYAGASTSRSAPLMPVLRLRLRIFSSRPNPTTAEPAFGDSGAGESTSTTFNTALPSRTLRTLSMSQLFVDEEAGEDDDDEPEKASQKADPMRETRDCDASAAAY